MERTEVPIVEGRTAARASPVKMAGIYSGLPNPDTNANAEFWLSPFASAVSKTINSRNTKEICGFGLIISTVDSPKSNDTQTYIVRAQAKRRGYEALSRIVVRRMFVDRIVIPKMTRFKAWKWARIQVSESNWVTKMGTAAIIMDLRINVLVVLESTAYCPQLTRSTSLKVQ